MEPITSFALGIGGLAAGILLLKLSGNRKRPVDLPEYDELPENEEHTTRATALLVAAIRNDERFRAEFMERMQVGTKWLGPNAAIAYLLSPDKKDKRAQKLAHDLLRHAISQIDGDYLAKNWTKITLGV